MFDSTREDLKDILRKIHEAKLQLPDFQRDYVWRDDDVRSLIGSIAKGFPVGALLTLETGGVVEFKPRVLAGVEANGVEPNELLLDGQQRMTSLYQSMFSKGSVRTRTQRDTEVERFYYLDMKQAVATAVDLEDAIVGVPGDKILKARFGRDIELDLSSPTAEFEQNMFPLNRCFDSTNWNFEWRGHWNDRRDDLMDLEGKFFRGIIDGITHYKMPIIRLDRDNSREAICLVFEKVNVGGMKLDAFELVTAIYAAHQFDLREDWFGPPGKAKLGRRGRMIGDAHPRSVLSKLASTDLLQACTLLHTRENRLARAAEGLKDRELPQISCKREALLALPLAAYKQHADAVERGFVDAAAFLNELKIIRQKDIPYPPQIVALAATFGILGDKAATLAAKEKLVLWFWSITLGEQYGSSTESKLARDVPQLVDWIGNDGSKPRSVDESIFQQDRLRSLRSRQSAAYKGLHALMMGCGCNDFVSGRPVDIMTFFNDKIDIHHIFPKDWCKKQGIEPAVYNSIINKTPLSKKSNIAVGGHAPSKYLKKIEGKHSISSEQLDEILRTHLIEPEYLRADDFEAFFNARIKALSSLVSDAMGKPVVEDRGVNEEEIEPVLDEDEEELAENAA